MSDKPIISVIIPLFNREKHILDALNSIPNSQDIEVIVINDGSTDDSVSVVENYCKGCPNLRVINNNRKKGAQGARNTGILASTAQLITFLDSDDEFIENGIFNLIHLWRSAKRTDAWVSGNMHIRISVGMERIWSGYEGRDPLLRILTKPVPGYGGMLVPRSNLLEIGLLDENIKAFQEWDTSIRLAFKFPIIENEIQSYLWTSNSPDSISKNKRVGSQSKRRIYRKHMLRVIPKIGAYQWLKNYLFTYETVAILSSKILIFFK